MGRVLDIGVMLILLGFGVYILLLGYRIIPLNEKDLEKAELMHRKYDKLWKICGTVGILASILAIVGMIMSK